jgi:DNA-binding transcriptional LysR family regulator
MPLDLELVRRFAAVAETRSFRRAADSLGVSQPPLTRSIQQLEATFGTLLLERGARGVELTPTGKILLEQSAELLAHAERVFRTTKTSMESRRLVVGLTGLHGEMATGFGAFQARWIVPSRDIVDLESAPCGPLKMGNSQKTKCAPG